MSFPDRYAILLDGEWLKKTIQHRAKGQFPSHTDILNEVGALQAHGDLAGLAIYRVFYYTADPLTSRATNPISKVETNFASTSQHSQNLSLINMLENQPDFAVRRGQLVLQGWKIRPMAIQALSAGTKSTVTGADLKPNINQKGVDMMIGLDMASLAIKRLVSTVVVVSGDSDLVPAMKLARTEGLRVYLATLGEQVRPELKIHADRILS